MKHKESSPFQIKSLSSMKSSLGTSEEFSSSRKSHKIPMLTQEDVYNFRPSSAPITKNAVKSSLDNRSSSEGIVFLTPSKNFRSSNGTSDKAISSSTKRSKSGTKSKASELLQRFRNAPPMSRKERMLSQGDSEEFMSARSQNQNYALSQNSSHSPSQSPYTISSLNTSSRKHTRPRSGGTTNQSTVSPYQTTKFTDRKFNLQNSSPKKKPKRRSSDSSLLHLNGHSLTSFTTMNSMQPSISNPLASLDTLPKRHSVDYSGKALTDESLTMSMIRNNLRDIPLDGDVEPDYDRIKQDVKKMFGDIDVSLSFGNEIASSLDSKRPKSSSVKYRQNIKGKSPLLRRYSVTNSQEANSSTELKSHSYMDKTSSSPLNRTNSPYLKHLHSSSPHGRRRSTPEILHKKKSVYSMEESSPLSLKKSPSSTSDFSSSKKRSKSASGVRGKPARRKLIVNSPKGSQYNDQSNNYELSSISKDLGTSFKNLHSELENKPLHEDVPRRRRSVTSFTMDNEQSEQSGRHVQYDSKMELSSKKIEYNYGIQRLNNDFDDLTTIHPSLDLPTPTYGLPANMEYTTSTIQKETGQIMKFVFTNMKLKTYFKFTIEEAQVTKRPTVKHRQITAKPVELSDPLVNVLQKKAESVRERISNM